MPTYLDVAAVRIQPYIARTPSLRLRRGASRLLTTATRSDAVDTWLAEAGLSGVTRNRDAGDVDGVVSLIVADDTEQVAEQVLLHLREHLPAVELQAVWATADDYLAARKGLDLKRSDPLVALPVVADFSLGETCHGCRVDHRLTSGEFCVDCQARDEAADRFQSSDGESSAIEQELLDHVNDYLPTRLRTVRILDELSRMGDAGGNRNHLATVAMDGNGLGAFFAGLVAHGDPELKRTISPAIAEATRNSLGEATEKIVRSGTDRWLPVVPHVLGGDDLVVSVVADRAWPFVEAFMDSFKDLTSRLSVPDGITVPTMSAGVVFAHHKFPYARAVALAERVLRRAKQDTKGAEPAICWLDVTTEGEELPSWRRGHAIEELRSYESVVQSIARLDKTAWQTLVRLLSADSAEEASAAMQSWARRNGFTTLQTSSRTVPIEDLRALAGLAKWRRS